MESATPSISSLVAKAVSSGIQAREPERRHGQAARDADLRILHIICSRNPEDDSDFDDSYISDHVWNLLYKYEEEEFDQHIFNVFRKDKIASQERKVNVTTAVCVRDCPEKAEEIAMWSRHAKPVLSMAPKKRKLIDLERAERDAELDRTLAQAVEDISKDLPNIKKSTYKKCSKGGKKKRRKT